VLSYTLFFPCCTAEFTAGRGEHATEESSSNCTSLARHHLFEGSILIHISSQSFIGTQVSQIPPSGKQVVADTENVIAEDGQSSESVMTALHSGSSQDNDDGSDVSLKLG
jgi:hypothetical protein